MSEWVKSSGNVFEDLGFDPAEAEVLKVKTQLKIALEKEVKRRPMFNKVMTGKLSGISIDKMIQIHSRLGKSVDVRVKRTQKKSAA